jgi:hypothetical protein
MRVAFVDPVALRTLIEEEIGFRVRIKGGSGVRVPDVILRDAEGGPCCPHEYAEVMAAIFERYPNARIRTPITIYRDRDDFLLRRASTLRRALETFPCDVDHDQEEED